MAIHDVLAGLYGAFGAVSALVERNRTGRGQVVRTSLLASLVGGPRLPGPPLDGRWVPEPVGNDHPSIAPYGFFRCGDHAVQIACGTDAQWQVSCAVLGRTRPRRTWGPVPARVARRDRRVEIIEEALSAWTAQDIIHALEKAGVPAGRVRNRRRCTPGTRPCPKACS